MFFAQIHFNSDGAPPTNSFKGEWLTNPNMGAPPARPPKTKTISSSSDSTNSYNVRDSPPPRPKKDKGSMNYAELDLQSNRRSFMNDPRNQVLPSAPTSYAHIVPGK